MRIGIELDWIDQCNSTRQREEARLEKPRGPARDERSKMPNARDTEASKRRGRGRESSTYKYNADTRVHANHAESLQKVIGCFKHESSSQWRFST